MDRHTEISKEVLKRVRKELEVFSNYPRPEISLKEIENKILFQLGCRKEKSRRGTAVKYSHTTLERDRRYTAGIFSIHRKGGSKDKPMIGRNDFKAYLLPHIKRILEALEGGQNEHKNAERSYEA